jgi:hypothetical protein
MKALIQEIYARPAFGRIVEWGKLVSITGFSQIIIQGLGSRNSVASYSRIWPLYFGQHYAWYDVSASGWRYLK